MLRRPSFRAARLLVATGLLAIGLLAGSAGASEDPNTARGFSPDNLYQFGEFDTVDLFNGNLSLVLPIGNEHPLDGGFSYGLKLTYNSNVWDFSTRSETFNLPGGGFETHYYTRARPGDQFNAGLGWNLSLGELRVLPSLKPVYVGADGGSHTFYQNLHQGEPVHTGVSYTRDGSYLRLDLDTYSATVEFPDGSVHSFTRASTSEGFKLVSIEDAFGNGLDVGYSNGDRHWTLSDGYRTHHVYFVDKQSDGRTLRMVDRVVLAAFGGTTATYQFNYDDQFSTVRHCSDTDAQTSPSVTTPVLTSVSLPDGSSWTMSQYNTVCAAGPGMLGRLGLPTLGAVDWEYAEYHYPVRTVGPPGGPPVSVQTNFGVSRKRLLNASGICHSLGEVGCEWQYVPATDSSNPIHRTTTVHLPTTSGGVNDRIVHHFSQTTELDLSTSSGRDGWQYGLPIHPSVTSGGRRLSQEIFHGNTKVREIWLEYGRDEILQQIDPAFWYDRNRRVKSRQTVYLDDASRYKRETFSDFDGLGHFRATTLESNFTGGGTRVHRSEYNATNGTYTVDATTNQKSGNYSAWPTGSPWVLGTYTETSQTEGGGSPAVQQFCFAAATGALLRQRTLAGSTPGSKDVLVVNTYDGQGNRTLQRHYGGDTGSVGTGALCSTGVGSERYRRSTTYQYGQAKSVQWQSSSGGAVLDTYRSTVDANTGLPKTVTDANDLVTTLSYDTSGRLLSEVPQSGHGARTTYTYTRATSASAPAKVLIRTHNNAGSVVLTSEEVRYDPFGRVWQQRRKEPSGSWSTVVTAVNARGWTHSVSERQYGWPSQQTVFKDFDAFGRPGKIVPPDGSGHQVLVQYTGDRRVRRDYKVCTLTTGCTSSSQETTFDRTELYDKHDRLYQVQEPSGLNGSQVYTTYHYDVGNRLRQATTSSGGVTQTRLFNYDHRGFLTSERHPEKGTSGNGYVHYSIYDPLGNPGRKLDGGHDLRYHYDRAGRLEHLNELVSGVQRPLKVFTYGTGNAAGDLRKGQLVTADRYNYVLLGANPFTVRFQETYVYGGTAGAVSRRDTQMWVNGSPAESFTQGFAWRDIGNLNYLDYPECTHGCGAASPRRVQFNFNTTHREYLTSVQDLTSGTNYASAFTYHPNGMVATTSHGNGVADHQDLDPSGMARPARIRTTGANSNWDSGTYHYDGSGNITYMGSSRYAYDGVNRLTQAKVGAYQSSGGNYLTRSYTYDPFGNLQNLGGYNVPENPSTNRLNGTPYDAAGNVLNWNGTGFEYDALGMITKRIDSTGGERLFFYTADDERLWSYHWSGSSWTIRDLDGKVLREYRSGPGGWSVERDYVYANGKLLAGRNAQGTVYHYHPDHLGTPRLITNQFGNKMAYHAYYPYGEELTSWNQDSERMKFTGHERDFYDYGAGDDLDYQHARYYNFTQGRYLSMDPINSEDLTLPQSWNKYVYTRNNPLKYTDPNGEAVNLVAGGVGALIGGAAGAIGSLVSQGISSDGGINWKDVAASAAGGAVSGGLAGLTFGTSLVASGAGVLAVSAATNVAGGAVSRELDSSNETQALDAKAVVSDAAWGAAGGAVAAKVDAVFADSIQAAEKQIATSTSKAGQGSYAAQQSVKGHQAKAQALRTTQQVASTVAGAKTANIVGPAATATAEKACQNGRNGCF